MSPVEHVHDTTWLQVITGPNMSGKSCFLKAVGIIVFLAHVGSFVPAEAAVVGLTDRLFTRMASLQARAPLQSSFMSELSQIAAMLHCASQRQAPLACPGRMSLLFRLQVPFST